MASHLIQDLLSIGDQMKTCLENGDLDTFYDLVSERGTLLETLQSYRHPSEIDENWEERATVLSDQNAELMEAAETQRGRMKDAVTRLEQVKEAQRSYLRPGGRPNILNQNLRA